jgi:hypothetical protein
MIGIVRTIVQFAPNKRRLNIEVEGSLARTFIVEGFKNSGRWKEIKVGDVLDGLAWDNKDEKIIDADSLISVLKSVQH